MAVQHAWHLGILRAMAAAILAVRVEIGPGHPVVCGVLEVHWGYSSILCLTTSNVQNKLQLVAISNMDLARHQLGSLAFLRGSNSNCLPTTEISNLNKKIMELLWGHKKKKRMCKDSSLVKHDKVNPTFFYMIFTGNT